MKQEDFDLFATLLKQRSGLQLTPEKVYLLESRLLPVTRKWNLKSLDDLAAAIRTKPSESMLSDVTEAMTTNESFFFRDQKPFTTFQKTLLPQLIASRAAKKHLRIWSAASSSGQEAYSIAMIFAEEAAKLPGWKIEIIGTDLSKDMVARAKSGIYSQFEVQRGLPITMLMKYFQQNAEKWQIKENIRQMVQFREGNLLTDLSSMGVFDVIFCRNVLIYFDPPTKTKVLDSMSKITAPDGSLFLGSAESVFGLSNKYKVATAEHGHYILATAPDKVPAQKSSVS